MKSLFGSQRSISYQQVWGRGDDWIAESPEAKAVATSATLACVDIKAASIMAMPLQEFRVDAAGRAVKVPTGARSRLLLEPSTVFELEEWVYAAVASATLYDQVVGVASDLGSNGLPNRVEWVSPRRVTVRVDRGRPVYTVDGVEHLGWRFGGDIVHLRRRPVPGRADGGLSTSKALGPLIAAGLAGARALADTYMSGGLPMTVMAFDGKLDREEAEQVSSAYESARRKNRGRPLVLGKGWSFNTVQRGDVIADMAPLRRQIATEIATVYGVPPELVGGDSGGSMTYSNLEGLTRHLEARTLLADYSLLERAISRLLPEGRFCRFNSDAIIRTSLLDRMRAHDMALRDGWRSRDEIRDLEDLPAIPDGSGGEFLWPPYRSFPVESDQ